MRDSPDLQPAMRPSGDGPRPPGTGMKTLRNGWAVARLAVLIAVTGIGAAAVVAIAVAALVIAVNGSLP
jgi:hypothetical protein